MASFAPKSFISINNTPHRVVSSEGGRLSVENCYTGETTSFDQSSNDVQTINPTLKTHKIEFLQPQDRTTEDISSGGQLLAQVRGLEKHAPLISDVYVPGGAVGEQVRDEWGKAARGYGFSATVAEWNEQRWIVSVP